MVKPFPDRFHLRKSAVEPAVLHALRILGGESFATPSLLSATDRQPTRRFAINRATDHGLCHHPQRHLDRIEIHEDVRDLELRHSALPHAPHHLCQQDRHCSFRRNAVACSVACA